MMNNVMVARAMAVLEDDNSTSEAYDCAAYAAWHAMTGAQQEVLGQLIWHGPVYDGNIISKAARGDLFDFGLAVRCCFKGEQGYTAAAYRGLTIWKAGNANYATVPLKAVQ